MTEDKEMSIRYKIWRRLRRHDIKTQHGTLGQRLAQKRGISEKYDEIQRKSVVWLRALYQINFLLLKIVSWLC